MADAAIRLLHRRMVGALWVMLWVGAAAVVLTHFATADGARLARGSHAGAPVVPASIRLLRMTVSETTVEVTVLGRPDLARAEDPGPATLTDSAGNEHPIRQGSISGRTLTVSFDGAASVASGRARVEFPHVALTDDPIGAGPEGDHLTEVALELLLELEPTGGPTQTANLNASAVDVGGHSATVTSVVRDDESVVVVGHLDGFIREEIESLDLRETHLVLTDGTEQPFMGGSFGDGPGLRDFVFRFALPRNQSLARLDLHVGAQVPPIVRAEASPDTLARLDALEAGGPFVLTVAFEP